MSDISIINDKLRAVDMPLVVVMPNKNPWAILMAWDVGLIEAVNIIVEYVICGKFPKAILMVMQLDYYRKCD